MTSRPAHDNLANGFLGIVSTVYVWIVGHLTDIHAGIQLVAAIGGLVVIYVTISRGFISRRKERLELRRLEETMTTDVHLLPPTSHPVVSTPVVPPRSDHDSLTKP